MSNNPAIVLPLIVPDRPLIVDTLPSSMFLSSTLTVVELMVSIEPLMFTLPVTFKSPVRLISLPTDTLPPILAPPVVTISAVSCVLPIVNEPSTVNVDFQTGLLPSLVRTVLFGPIASLFKMLVADAYVISPAE